MSLLSWQSLKSYRNKIGQPWFTGPWDLNVFVIRSEAVGQWDDWLVVAAQDEFGHSAEYRYRVTSDAWGGEWIRPTHPQGSLYVVDQHARGAFEPGLHRGRRAMIQVAPMEYVRWDHAFGRVPSVDELERLSGRFVERRGTHIHDRSSDAQPESPAPNDSEGCVVFLRRADRDHFLALVELQRRFVGTARVSVTFARLSLLEG